MKQILFFLLWISCISCIKDSDKHIIAKVNGENVYLSEIENLIRQELYDELLRIFQMKSIALDKLIEQKLILEEANSYEMDSSDFIEYYVKNKINSLGEDSLKRYFRIDSTLPFHYSKSIDNISVNTLHGELLLNKALKNFITQELIDSLKENRNIQKFISPPISPKIDLKNLPVYYRGNLSSDVKLIIVSDFDCDKCKEAKPLYSKLYEKYKDRVKFGYINFSSVPSLGAIASDIAFGQNLFWEYHDRLYEHEGLIDSVTVYKIAEDLKMKMADFNDAIQSSDISKKLEMSTYELSLMGIYGTPTVLINNRLVVNSNSVEEISFLIEEELNSL